MTLFFHASCAANMLHALAPEHHYSSRQAVRQAAPPPAPPLKVWCVTSSQLLTGLLAADVGICQLSNPEVCLSATTVETDILRKQRCSRNYQNRNHSGQMNSQLDPDGATRTTTTTTTTSTTTTTTTSTNTTTNNKTTSYWCSTFSLPGDHGVTQSKCASVF